MPVLRAKALWFGDLRLERAYLAYYFSLEIELSGELGKQAASDPTYRHLGVSAIAKCLDPNYDRPVRKATNYRAEEDLREIAEGHKEDLLKYCGDILSGDVSSGLVGEGARASLVNI